MAKSSRPRFFEDPDVSRSTILPYTIATIARVKVLHEGRRRDPDLRKLLGSALEYDAMSKFLCQGSWDEDDREDGDRVQRQQLDVPGEKLSGEVGEEGEVENGDDQVGQAEEVEGNVDVGAGVGVEGTSREAGVEVHVVPIYNYSL